MTKPTPKKKEARKQTIKPKLESMFIGKEPTLTQENLEAAMRIMDERWSKSCQFGAVREKIDLELLAEEARKRGII